MQQSMMMARGDVIARPTRAETKAERRAAIVAAALRVFTAKGFDATRMIDVAREAGVAKGTLYLYFADKETLFEGIVRQVILPMLAAGLESEPRSGEPVKAFLKRTLVPLANGLESSGLLDVIRMLIAEATRLPALSRIYFTLVVEPGMRRIELLVKRAVDGGELADDTLARFPQLLMAPAITGVIWSGLFGRMRRLDIGAMVSAHIDSLFHDVRNGTTPVAETELQ